MDDAGAQFAADAAQVVKVVQERVDERAVLIAGGRVNDHAAGLQDDGEVVILIENRERNFLRDGDEALALYPDPTALEEKVLMRETMAAVRRAIAELPEKEQQVLRLKVLENRTDAEIAAETGLSPGSIRQYLHRARGRLREKLF